MAKVNILIPVYNGERYLEETVRSILSQTFSDFSAVFVDDGSTDRSVDILKKAAAGDNRIVVVEKPHEGSVPFTWNYIFPRLDAEWTLYMSHDDLLEPSLLQSLVDVQAMTGADAVIPSCHFFSDGTDDHRYDDKNRANDMTPRAQGGCISGKEAFELMLDYTIPGFALWRTSLIREAGMPTESYNSDEGMQRLWANACRKVAFSGVKFYYRLVPGAITTGLKPYHYYSLLTNRRLLEAASTAEISADRLRQFHYYCISSLLYLKSTFRTCGDAYTEAQRDGIRKVFSTVYPVFSKRKPRPRNVREAVLFISCTNRIFFNMAVRIFAGRLHKS